MEIILNIIKKIIINVIKVKKIKYLLHNIK